MEHKLNLESIKTFFTKYRYVALILLIGICLMLIPEKNITKKEAIETVSLQNEPKPEAERLAEILSQIQGAGKVQVMLSVRAGEEMLYQTDTQTDSSGSVRIDTVLVSDSNREETGLLRQIKPPVYLGAVVVCQGADSSSVRLSITEAVSKITGLGADCIVVLKMK